MDKANIFVSYSHVDKDWVDKDGEYKLISWLSTQLEDDAEIWTDHALEDEIGEEYETHILKRIEEASFVVLLISQNFVSSKFIMNTELPLIKKLYDEKKIKIFPIYLSDLSLSGKQRISWLFKLNIYPSETKPLIEITQDKRKWIKSQICILDNIQIKISHLTIQEEMLYGYNEDNKTITEDKHFNLIKMPLLIYSTITCLIFVVFYLYIYKDSLSHSKGKEQKYSIEMTSKEVVDYYYDKGNSYLKSGQTEMAIYYFNLGRNKDPNNPNLVKGLSEAFDIKDKEIKKCNVK